MLLAPHCGQPGSLSYRRAPSARGDCRCWLRTKRDYIAIHLAKCGGSCFRTMASMLMFAPPQQVCVTSLRTSIAVRECCPWKTKHIASERETYFSLPGCVARTAGATISQHAHGRREQSTTHTAGSTVRDFCLSRFGFCLSRCISSRLKEITHLPIQYEVHYYGAI